MEGEKAICKSAVRKNHMQEWSEKKNEEIISAHFSAGQDALPKHLVWSVAT